jgi:nitroreductase
VKNLEVKKKVPKIKVIVLSILIFLVMAICTLCIIDGRFSKQKYTQIWNAEYIASLDSDGEKIIAGALKASSSHNMQPWKVKKIDNMNYELYADMSKDLMVIDSDHKQMLISQGTFIEAFSQTAIQYGYQVKARLENMDFSVKQPLVATLKLDKKSEKTNVNAISSSSVNPKVSENGLAGVKEELEKDLSVYPSLDYELISEKDLQNFKGVLLKGTEIESRNQAATEELLEVFRWTERDKNKFRYGLALNNMSPIMQSIIQPVMKVFPSTWEAFGEQGIKSFKTRLEGEKAYILIKSTTTSPQDYISVGRLYQTFSQNVGGYTIRPAIQVLETFDDMKGVNQAFQLKYGKTETVMLIIGLQELNSDASQSRPAPRHLVEDVLIP